MATSTKLIVVNKITLPEEAKHFVFYQDPLKPGLSTDVFVWRTLNIQSGGGQGYITVPFDVQYTASVSHSPTSVQTSKSYSAINGDVLTVTKDTGSDAPILTKTSSGFKIYI